MRHFLFSLSLSVDTHAPPCALLTERSPRVLRRVLWSLLSTQQRQRHVRWKGWWLRLPQKALDDGQLLEEFRLPRLEQRLQLLQWYRRR